MFVGKERCNLCLWGKMCVGLSLWGKMCVGLFFVLFLVCFFKKKMALDLFEEWKLDETISTNKNNLVKIEKVISLLSLFS